jgi:16S rRNA (guanine527-N7)-methyltransferase
VTSSKPTRSNTFDGARAEAKVAAVTSSFPSELAAKARPLGVELEGELGVQLGRYLTRLLDANREFNLTSITDPDEAWRKHILDSLTVVPMLRALGDEAHVIDVGSGGGLPGVPIALALPTLRFTLLEATAKKARFLAQTASALGITNLQVENDRAESFGRGAGREQFEGATARAVSRLPVLLELVLPLIKPGGTFVAIKGQQAEVEIDEAARAMRELQAEVERVERTETGTLIAVRKLGATPARYPRRPGEPKRSPL